MSVFCVRIYAGIPYNGFGLPMLGYLRILDFVIQNHYKEFLREYAENFHISIKKLRICANNPVLEDSVIQNRY